MLKTNRLILLFLLLGAFFIVACNQNPGKGLKQGPYIYTVKIICGDQPFGGYPQAADVARMPGHYATSINIHNPNLDSVYFEKKAILLEEGRPQGQGPKSQTPVEPGKKKMEILAPNWGMQMVCYDFQVLLNAQLPNAPIAPAREGFIVFESEMPLDIVAVYTYTNRAAEVGMGVSMDVEYIEASRTKK